MPSRLPLPLLLALAVALAIGGPIIRGLRALQARPVISADAPQPPQAKSGNPASGLGLSAVALFLLCGFISSFGTAIDRFGITGDHGLAAFSMAMAGACLGFLWFNAHPAAVFMGDTGSLGLGGGMAALAIMLHAELPLLLAAGVYLAEAASVIIQVASFQTTGRRVFRMSPLHHHFELAGWPETRVVIRFWILAIVLSALTLYWLLQP